MSKLAAQATRDLRQIILDALGRAVAEKALPMEPAPDFTIETPADPSHGDFATNVAMVSAKAFHMAPRKIAEALSPYFEFSGTYFEKFEIAGPGFINFFLSPRFYAAVLQDIEALQDGYGRSDFGKGKKINVEFVSANPTGPMHMGNARGGALGDCLAAVLDAAGYQVSREFYINDAGNQIDKFALSLDIRYQQIFKGEEAVPMPEDCYQGADILERAQEFAGLNGDGYLEKSQEERQKALVDFALPKNIAKMQSDLKKYRIEYDTWFHESVLHNDGEIQDTLKILTEKGMTYELDGALWYKATDFGAEKDEVLVRKNGNPTYFAADIAYHRHVARMKGAMNAVGLDGSKLDVVLMQLVKLVRNGEIVRMSKRTGKAIQLADLLDEVPVDAARFLFNMREANSQMEFDLDLAVQQDAQNPVYYVQYAHARICSILKALEKDGVVKRACSEEELLLLVQPEELSLIRHLAAYTGEVVSAAKDYDPARITRYVIDLANLFHKFYNACRVKGEEDSLCQARLTLCVAVKTVIHNVLTMYKMSAPESM